MEWEIAARFIEVVSAVAVVIGVWFAVIQLAAVRRQEHRQFENLYVQRYWQIIDRLSADFRLRRTRDNLSERDLLALLSYLELCEDEADLYESGRITRETWNVWKAGIDSMLEEDVFRAILEDSEADKFMTIRRYIAEGRLAPKYRGTKAALRGL